MLTLPRFIKEFLFDSRGWVPITKQKSDLAEENILLIMTEIINKIPSTQLEFIPVANFTKSF